MAGIQLPGLASGLDSAALIASLMKLESQPQTLLKQRVSDDGYKLQDFQSLNSKLAALIDSSKTAAKDGGIRQVTATSSNPSVTVTAAATADSAGLDFTVTQIAQRHQVVTAAMTSWPDGPPSTITVVGHDGTKTQVTAATAKIDDVVTAVNNAATGIKATKIASGVDGSGNALYRIQFTADDTGEDGQFQVFSGSPADVDTGTATNILAAPGSSVLRTGQDATLTLFAGTTAEQQITSASNTFAGVIPGVDVTVTAVTADPVQVQVSTDNSKTAASAKTFIDQVDTILSYIKVKSATTTATDPTTNATTTSLGSFTSDASTRQITQNLQDAIQDPVNGRSPSEIGISFDKNGELSFDADKFAAAMAKDPDGTQAFFSAIATRVNTVATASSDPYEGFLTSAVKNQQSQIKDMNDQITVWDKRLSDRQAQLESIYANLEVQMSALNSQSSYLAGQIDSLPTWSGSSKK